MAETLLRIGIITSTHGIKGEVKIFPTTDNPERFKKVKEVNISDNGKDTVLEVESAKVFKQYAIVKFKTINSIEEAQLLRQKELYVKREHAQKLLKDEYYIADLIGMEVILEDGTNFGVLKDVLETGANDVYIIETGDKKEILLPAIKECILNIDVDNNKMKVHILEGLLD